MHGSPSRSRTTSSSGDCANLCRKRHSRSGSHRNPRRALPNGWWNPGYLVVNKSNIDKILARQKSAATQYAYFKNMANAELAHPSKYLQPMSKIN